MSRHWRPDWTVIENHDHAPPKPRGRMVLLALATLFAGAAGWLGWEWWNSRPAESGPPAEAIEWNAVQAVPTRAPDAEDVEWEKRAGDFDRASGGMTVAGQQIYVIDGDTFDLNGERIRVAGIDAPETHPSRCPKEARLGNAATEELAELLRGRPLWISGTKTDRYGRSVRTVRVGGEDVADTMIGAGLARSYDGGKRQGWC